MKHLKSYNLYDSVQDSISIIYKLNRDKDAVYSLTEDGLINVDGDVELWKLKLKEIPVKFGKVTGKFNISHNKITSLVGCPTYVGNYFSCAHNNLKSLKHGPEYVGEDCYCSNNKLSSLEGCPKIVEGSFYCDENRLTHLGELLKCRIKYQIYAEQHLLDDFNEIKNKSFEL